MSTKRPILLLDVDGVLALRSTTDSGYTKHKVVSLIGESHELFFNQDHGPLIRLLSEVFEVVWTTGWEHDAPRILGPLLDLAEFPVLTFTERPQIGKPLSKLSDVDRFVGDRPTVWIDDQLGDDVVSWAKSRKAQTVLVQPSPAEGLQPHHVSELLCHAFPLAGTQNGVRHRVGVVIVRDGKIAVIERKSAGVTYYLLPGGRIESSETLKEAAKRAAMAELNVEIEVSGPIAHTRFDQGDSVSIQHYLAAEIVSGILGPGSIPEDGVDGDPSRDSYQPAWIDLEDTSRPDVRPASLLVAIRDRTLASLLAAPFVGDG